MVFKPILTKKEIRKIVAAFKRSLKKAGVKVSRLILFGSYAKRQPHPWSDVDICVLSTQFGKRDFDEMVKIARIAKGVNYLLEPHPMNPKDLELGLHPLSAEIKKTGKRI